MVFSIEKNLIKTGDYCNTILIPAFFMKACEKKGKTFKKVTLEIYDDYIVLKPVFENKTPAIKKK